MGSPHPDAAAAIDDNTQLGAAPRRASPLPVQRTTREVDMGIIGLLVTLILIVILLQLVF